MNLTRGLRVPAGVSYATVLPDMDFETYSEAGFIWNGEKFVKPKGAQKAGISAVGAVVYAQHATAEILSLAYDLKEGLGPRLWIPGLPLPRDLFEYLATGGLIEAHNSNFEYYIWEYVCYRRMGWPRLPFTQLRDSADKARAHGYPGALEKAATVCGAKNLKIADGKRLLNKFSIPRKPTIKDARKRITPAEDLIDAQKLYEYNIGDILAEQDVSLACPDLTPQEQEFADYTHAMNIRGIGLDMETVNAGCIVLDRALEKYNAELHVLTGGAVSTSGQAAKLIAWLGSQGVKTKSVDKQHVIDMLDNPSVTGAARRAVEIRQLTGSAGVKKLYAMQRMCAENNRAHDLFVYHGAQRTGRDSGKDIQPQNLVKAGPKLLWCEACNHPYGSTVAACPHCSASAELAHAENWSHRAVDTAVSVIRTGQFEEVERIFGDALLTIGGCVRGMFHAAPGCDFVCSDYSSIEAVVTAVLAGEQWRIDSFNKGDDIYLRSAGRVTGKSYEYYQENGFKSHPDRQKIGKPAELALGFGGYIGAWRRFDKSDTFTDQEVKNLVLAWREASPAIVELWGGQVRGKPWAPDWYELYGIEGAVIKAIQNPGQIFWTHGLGYGVKNDNLYCRLPSGRLLTYHNPRLRPSDRNEGQLKITFMGWNSNHLMGPMGWVEIETYGAKTAQNAVQATARDIMRHAVPPLERAGYPIVHREHDALMAEIPEGFGSIEEFEQIMQTLPDWAEGWPIRATDGWRGKRYRKD